MFWRPAFQSMHLKLSSFPITQLMNWNNAIPHIRGSLSCTEGPLWVRWWAVTHPGFITVWFIPMAARTCFKRPVLAKKAKSFTENCLRKRNPQDPFISLISLTTVDQSLSVIYFELPVRDLSGKFKPSFFQPPNQKQIVVCSQPAPAVNF